jgi:peptidoglycan/LPS O-acetylase OafA/YrhL
MVFLGTYSYGLYVYHHFISYYLTTNRTEFELAHWLGSHGAAVALQATVGASISLALAYLSYELFEKRFLRLKRLFATAEEPGPQRLDARQLLDRKSAPSSASNRAAGSSPAFSCSLRFSKRSGLNRDSNRGGMRILGTWWRA